jgi:hypothetical protein
MRVGAAPRSRDRRAHHVGVAVHGEEVEAEAGEAPDRGGDGGGDVEELHVEKDPLAHLLQLEREAEPAAGEHAEADLVEGDVLAERPHQFHPGMGVRQVEADDQAVVGLRGRVERAGLGHRRDPRWGLGRGRACPAARAILSTRMGPAIGRAVSGRGRSGRGC